MDRRLKRAIIKSTSVITATLTELIIKYNPNHGPDGRFTSGGGSGGSGGGENLEGPVKISSKLHKKYPPANPKGVDSLSQHTRPDGTLTPERQKLHDDIVKAHLEGVPKGLAHPEAHFMGGGPASGKSSVEDGGLIKRPKSKDTVEVDSDRIKGMLPEYQELVAGKNSKAASFSHEESSMLAKRIMAEGLAQRSHVFLDGTGDSGYNKLAKKIADAKATGHTVTAHYMTLDTNLAQKINVIRAKKTGRRVPESYLRNTHKTVSQILPKALDNKLFDKVTLWDNNIKGKPRKVVEQVNGKTTIHDKKLWNDFKAKGKE